MSTERFLLCWSHSQQAMHIEREAEGCRTNLRAFMLNQSTDYVPLAVFPNRAAASEFAREIEEVRGKLKREHTGTKEDSSWN